MDDREKQVLELIKAYPRAVANYHRSGQGKPRHIRAELRDCRNADCTMHKVQQMTDQSSCSVCRRAIYPSARE